MKVDPNLLFARKLTALSDQPPPLLRCKLMSMMVTRRNKFRFTLLLLLVATAAASVSAAEPSAGGAAPQLQDAPSTAGSAGDQADDGGSISAPATGTDAKSIIASSAHMMGTMDDSTDGNDDKNGGAGQGQSGGGHGGHHGQCVIGCASKSTDGVGCGKDLSKPECFCKSQDFIQQTFACINVTCPQQFHGAAGVIKSICSVAGAADLQIPGYKSSSNLENMPTINDDSKNNGTNATSTATTSPGSAAPPSGSEYGGGVTSTFTMPMSMQTPASSGSNGATTGNTTTTAGGSTSGANRIKDETTGAMLAISTVVIAASVGAWTLF